MNLNKQWLADEDVEIILPEVCQDNVSIWNQYTLRVIGSGRRDALRDHMIKSGVGAEIYYPLTMDQQPCFQNLPESSRLGCDVAHRLADEVISLPIYPELTAKQKEEVVKVVGEFVGETQN